MIDTKGLLIIYLVRIKIGILQKSLVMIFFTDYTLEMFEYIKGLHTLLEYIDNDKRYVLFSLFGSFWYKVEICKNFDSNAKLEHLEQYSLDSKIRISNSNAVAFNLDINNSTIKQVKREFLRNLIQ